MRIAIVSDIHGNRTAFEAVLADLRRTSPDLILHGGDLADGGANPAEIVDRVRDLGWPGVVGNTDEMLFRPESLTELAGKSPDMQPLFGVVEEMAAATREALGEERLAWLRGLPLAQVHGSMALVHASPDSAWRAPATGCQRRRTGGGVLAARTALCHLRAHPLFLRPAHAGNDRRQRG